MTAAARMPRVPNPTPAVLPPASRPPAVVRSYGLSDRGRVRDANEDCFVIAELVRTLTVRRASLPHVPSTSGCHRGYVLLVADGVGGHQAGEVASDLTARAIEEFLLNTLRRFTNLKPDEEQVALRDLQAALLQADARIFAEAACHPEWRGMGATLTLAFVAGWRLFVAHAGDTRCYLFSAGQLRQLTRDHTMTAEMVRSGILVPADQARHPWRHVVTNLLGGSEPGVRVELHSLDLRPGDTILLCSDGLTEMVPDEAVAAALADEADPRAACERLVREANVRGGRDNITAVVAHVAEPGGEL
jgi:serine/threonine protein phosphatase PrpC